MDAPSDLSPWHDLAIAALESAGITYDEHTCSRVARTLRRLHKTFSALGTPQYLVCQPRAVIADKSGCETPVHSDADDFLRALAQAAIHL